MNLAAAFEFGLATLNFGLAIIGVSDGWHLWPLNLAACVVCFCAGLTVFDI